MCHQKPATPVNNHDDDDDDDRYDYDGDDDGGNDDDNEWNLLDSFSIPASTPELRQDMGEPGQRGHLTITIIITTTIIIIIIIIIIINITNGDFPSSS